VPVGVWARPVLPDRSQPPHKKSLIGPTGVVVLAPSFTM
jgi:hypothetical protein